MATLHAYKVYLDCQPINGKDVNDKN